MLPAAECQTACLRYSFQVTPKAASGQAPAEFSIQGTVIYKTLCFHIMVQARISKVFIDANEHHLTSNVPRGVPSKASACSHSNGAISFGPRMHCCTSRQWWNTSATASGRKSWGHSAQWQNGLPAWQGENKGQNPANLLKSSHRLYSHKSVHRQTSSPADTCPFSEGAASRAGVTETEPVLCPAPPAPVAPLLSAWLYLPGFAAFAALSVCHRKSASVTINSVFSCGEAPPHSKEQSRATIYKKYSNFSVWNHRLDNFFLWLSMKMFAQTGPRSISSQNLAARHSCILQQHSLCTGTISGGSVPKKHCCSAHEWVASTSRKLWEGQFHFLMLSDVQ